jgi:cardiolipin synthase
MFKKSKSDIIIMSSYFLPGRDFRKRLRDATRRKVRVRVVLTQVSDVALAKSAERYLYHWLFKNKIEIYEYKKTVLHGKIAVCDQRWVSVGSYNLNELSAKASVEMNLEVDNEKFGSQVYATLNEIIQSDCVRVTEADFDRRIGWFEAAWQKIAYTIARILLFAFTFYFKQTKS